MTTLAGVIRDFDHYADLMLRWNLRTWLLRTGGFQADVMHALVAGGDHSFNRTLFHSPVRQVGAPPSGMRTFVIPAREDVTFIWRGHIVSGNEILLFPAGGELDASVRTGSEVLIVSISESRFADLAIALNFRRDREVFPCRTADLHRLRSALLDLESALLHQDGGPHTASLFEHALELLILALQTAPGQLSRRTLASRKRVVREAQRFIDENADSALTVQDLCLATGVTARTLQIGFREILDVSPKSYLRARRLNGVRAALARGELDTVVIADIANDWGFWHMGQFAADYRKLFGELPSQTLAFAGS